MEDWEAVTGFVSENDGAPAARDNVAPPPLIVKVWPPSPRTSGKALAPSVGSALIIGGTEIEENFGRAARNIPNIDVLPVQGINVYDILRRQKLVLTKAAVEALEARFK